jgi:hypothetical protein
MRDVGLFVPSRDVDASFVDDERWGRIPSSADALDNCNPLAIAWLNKLWPSASLYTCNNLHRANDAHLKACFVKVVHVVVVDAVLGFGVLYQLEPRANCLWILLEYPLAVLCSIERHLELIRTRHEPLSPVFAN